MIRHTLLSVIIIGSLIVPNVALSRDKPAKKGSTVKEVKSMSVNDQTALALSAAPARLAKMLESWSMARTANSLR